MTPETLPPVEDLRERLQPLIVQPDSILASATDAFVARIAGQPRDPLAVRQAWASVVGDMERDPRCVLPQYVVPALRSEFRRVATALFDADFVAACLQG